jgi:4-hydroxybenzoate polyprenyltransferase
LASRLRVIHPFPSALNGIAVVALAAVAGAAPGAALRLGLSMFLIQASIGVLNDIVDAPLDRGRRPPKPIAEGLIGPVGARVLFAGAAGLGLVLAAMSGWAAFWVALAGAACGYAYDLRLSRTAWGWVPLAIALPLVPLFAWLGSGATVPQGLLVLVPIGMLAGGGLAVGNALADLEVDRLAGSPSVAVRLGRVPAWRLHALGLGGAAALALASRAPDAPPVAIALLAGGAVLLAIGLGALAFTSHATTSRPTRLAWQLEAVGVAALGVGWVVALAG